MAENRLKTLLEPAPLLVKLAVWAGLGLLALATLVSFGLALHLYRVLPSESWMAQARPWANVTGTIIAGQGMWMVWMGLRAPGEPMPLWKVVLIMPFSAFLLFSMGQVFVFIAPALVGTVIGGTVEHGYTVKNVPGFSDRHCRRKIELADMPSLLDETCNWPDEVRAALEPGDRIELIGRGNAFGLEPSRIRY